MWITEFCLILGIVHFSVSESDTDVSTDNADLITRIAVLQEI